MSCSCADWYSHVAPPDAVSSFSVVAVLIYIGDDL
jgi:hypothetical protein